jgi:hypothetical protein
MNIKRAMKREIKTQSKKKKKKMASNKALTRIVALFLASTKISATNWTQLTRAVGC